jgi:hypothetical protein
MKSHWCGNPRIERIVVEANCKIVYEGHVEKGVLPSNVYKITSYEWGK